MTNEVDLGLLATAIEVARLARERGDHPFGAVLADEKGHMLMSAESTVVTTRDRTAHAEANLMREATKAYSPEELARCTLYASTEPCPMCAGAIFWGHVGRLVYALSQERLYALTGETQEKLLLSCRDVFERGARPIEVIGPALEVEAESVHLGFWR